MYLNNPVRHTIEGIQHITIKYNIKKSYHHYFKRLLTNSRKNRKVSDLKIIYFKHPSCRLLKGYSKYRNRKNVLG